MFTESFTPWLHRRGTQALTVFALLAMLVHLGLRLNEAPRWDTLVPLWALLIVASPPLLARVGWKFFHGGGGADLLGALELVLAIVLDEYLAASLVVLMLAGGEALEAYAQRRASSALEALAARMPAVAHRRHVDGSLSDVPLSEVAIGDTLLVFPGESCPVDGAVAEGHGSMDESYLTGEPYRISKTPGCEVISGAINGDAAVVIRATREAKDSRYAKIMGVMDASRQRRPRMRRLADTLGTLYTPLAVSLAIMAWVWSGDADRFLAVLVVATPCPLIIAIPVAIIGAISWCAKRGIIIKDPVVLELAHSCEVLITDKTGTLTVGEPALESIEAHGYTEDHVLQLAASLEQYSKHPLAKPVLERASQRCVALAEVSDVSEIPGQGLSGRVGSRAVVITGRRLIEPAKVANFAQSSSGLECVVLVDGQPAAVFRFRDQARPDSEEFVSHLGRHHNFKDIILLSGDRDQEVNYLAQQLKISRVYAGKSPEEKVAIVQSETRRFQTLFLGDGINDAPALTIATVGVAFGPRSDITSEAAGAVILEPALRKVDQLLHISAHLRRVALQSAVGGMCVSVIGMLLASAGYLTPVWGALTQEVIDLFAVMNALRASSLGRRESNHI